MKKIYYKVKIADDIKSGINLEEIKLKINEVLNDKNGWTKYLPFIFIEINEYDNEYDKYINVIFTNEVEKYCGFKDLSCYDNNNKHIYFNYNNWKNASYNFLITTNMSINDYQTYVINHEFGHVLGYEHLKCENYKGELTPVMVQQTKGIKGTIPNVYPTIFDINTPIYHDEYIDILTA